MDKRDRVREQGLPDRPPDTPTPGHEGEDRTDSPPIREEDDRVNERPAPAVRPGSGRVLNLSL
jgi:hypothetical protein